jgi:ferric-dicitrate binding protein FerR (iron transport regulator)
MSSARRTAGRSYSRRYALAALVPAWRAGALRLGLVTLAEMVDALVRAVEDPPPAGTRRIVDVESIRAS